MNKLLTLSLLLISLACFGQKADSLHRKIVLTEVEKMTIADHEAFVKQAETIQRELNIRQDEYHKFVQRLFVANKIPMDRISEKGDSLQFAPNEILIKLKPKKK